MRLRKHFKLIANIQIKAMLFEKHYEQPLVSPKEFSINISPLPHASIIHSEEPKMVYLETMHTISAFQSIAGNVCRCFFF